MITTGLLNVERYWSWSGAGRLKEHGCAPRRYWSCQLSTEQEQFGIKVLESNCCLNNRCGLRELSMLI